MYDNLDEKEKIEENLTPNVITPDDVDIAPDTDSAATELHDDEDIVEFVFNDDGEEDIKATLKKLRKDLKTVKAEKQDYLTALQRERADFQNYKKDEATRKAHMTDLIREGFVEELLPVLDAYDMAFANREAWEKVDKNWRMGVEYIHQQLIAMLANNRVVAITPKTGETFDPALHQSIETVATDNASEDHTIASVIQSGYKLGERVIRPARVRVFGVK